jgi:hypothetical protein
MAYTPRVYLAGPIQHANDNGKGWRARVKQNYDECEWIDPLDKYDATEHEYQEWTDEQIVEDDLTMIDNADALLVHWPRHASTRPAYPTEVGSRMCEDCGKEYSQLSKHYSMGKCEYPTPSEKEKEAIKGMVMSDGYIGNRSGTPRLDVQMVNPTALEQFAEEIPSFHPKMWKAGKVTDAENQIYRLTTISHPWLNEVASWYDSGKKVYPDNLSLSPTMAKWWYVGDGSMIWNKKAAHGYIQISCVNESENPEKLSRILSDFEPTVYSGGECSLNTENTRKFLDYIGEPVQGMKYKWKMDDIENYQREKPFTHVSTTGTPMEIRYAHEHDIFTVVQHTLDDPSPWLTYHANVCVDTFEEAVKTLTYALWADRGENMP